MYARSLERILRELTDKSDFGHEPHDAYERRFRALRGCALLPRGKERRGERLTPDHIVNAVFAVASLQPEQAGFVALMLAKLVPAGGAAASFFGARTLAEAVRRLLEDESARTHLKHLSLSTAEGGVNAHGYGVLLYAHPEKGLQQVSFVHRLATSVTGPGGEARIDPAARYAKVSRETVLNPRFFRALAREIENSKHWPAPEGDGEEYAVEEAKARRREKLGVRAHASYLNIGVDSHVTWPTQEQLINFDKYELVLMPRTQEHAASVHVDLRSNKLDHVAAMTVINQLLSVMSWVDDHYAIAEGGWAGNPIPVAVPKRELGVVTAHQWIFDRSIPQTAEARRALALYREGRNAQENFSVSYAVLNFYKVLEIPHGQQRGATKNWIRDNFDIVRTAYKFDEAFARLDGERGAQSVQDYLYSACRVAVSHASEKSPSDPDDAAEIRRLHTAADVLRWMARRLISTQLGVGEHPWEDASGDAEAQG